MNESHPFEAYSSRDKKKNLTKPPAIKLTNLTIVLDKKTTTSQCNPLSQKNTKNYHRNM